MERGYLKLWRSSLDSEVFASEPLWKLWSWCLLKTTYKKRKTSFASGKGKLTIHLNPGQFIFGRYKASEELDTSPSTVWKRMKKLEQIGNITIQSNSQYSIITLCNWATYQPDDIKKEPPSDHQGTTKEPPSDTNKKGNKDKKAKNKKIEENLFNPKSIRPEWINEKDWSDIIIHRKKHKAKPPETERAFNGIINQLEIAVSKGFTVSECVDVMCSRNWQSFTAEWMKNGGEKQKKDPKTFAQIRDANNIQALREFAND
jgi:biotin operon repressor